LEFEFQTTIRFGPDGMKHLAMLPKALIYEDLVANTKQWMAISAVAQSNALYVADPDVPFAFTDAGTTTVLAWPTFGPPMELILAFVGGVPRPTPFRISNGLTFMMPGGQEQGLGHAIEARNTLSMGIGSFTRMPLQLPVLSARKIMEPIEAVELNPSQNTRSVLKQAMAASFRTAHGI